MKAERYRVLVLGDFPSDRAAGQDSADTLVERSHQLDLARLSPFLDACDSVLASFELPLPLAKDLPISSASKAPRKEPDFEAAARLLRNIGVDAVNLATAQTVDSGSVALEATLQALNEHKISSFGAGHSLQDARAPHRLLLPERVGGGELHFHGSHQRSTQSEEGLGSYATDVTSGCSPLSVADMPWARLDSTPEDTFQIAIPHWGSAHGWKGHDQYRLAHRYLRKDYDLVLGHGSTHLQEVHRKQQRWIIYGLGNAKVRPASLLQRSNAADILPFNLVAVLEVQAQGGQRRVELKLYPVRWESPVANSQPGSMSETDFRTVLDALRSRPARPWRFDNPAQSAGKDELGYFVSLDLGAWPEGQRPARLEPILESGDPGDWPTRGPSVNIEDKVMALNKTVGSGMLALTAEALGGTSMWSSENIASISLEDRRFATFQFIAHESILGSKICIDKVLSASFFEKAGVKTPKTIAVRTAEEAVQAASSITGPVVVKPRKGLQSRGVSTGLTTNEEVREAFTFAKEHGPQVIVQQHIEAAEELRVMASPSEAVAVIRRILPHVVGDGLSTVSELIEDKNQQRALNPSLRNSRPIPVDALTRRHLSQNGYSLDSVPEIGQKIIVRNVAALSVGADAHQALESSDPTIKRASVGAVGAIPGLGWGGVDLILEKDTQTPYVIEINTNAAYGAALFPTYGKPLDVAKKVWDLRFAATVPDVQTLPERPGQLQGPHRLTEEQTTALSKDSRRFSTLFTEALRRQNYRVKHVGNRVLDVVSADSKRTWITSSGFTEADPYIVALLMRRHRRIHGLLNAAGVQSARGSEVSSARELQTFLEGNLDEVLLFPLNKSWRGPHANILTGDEAMAMPTLPTSMWVQSRPGGERVRVLATTTKTWVVTAQAESPPLSETDINAASDLAVHAVRAVPELRWAAVDVLVDPRRTQENRLRGVLVEGLTHTPRFSNDEDVIAGDFDAFARHIVESVP